MSNPGKTRQPLRRGNVPLTPSSKKRLTDLTRYMQKQVFNELLVIKGQNAGKLPYGAICDTVKKYDELGFSGKVTIHNLEYRFNLLSKGETMQCEKEVPLVLTTYNSFNISELTANSGMGNADIVSFLVSCIVTRTPIDSCNIVTRTPIASCIVTRTLMHHYYSYRIVIRIVTRTLLLVSHFNHFVTRILLLVLFLVSCIVTRTPIVSCNIVTRTPIASCIVTRTLMHHGDYYSYRIVTSPF